MIRRLFKVIILLLIGFISLFFGLFINQEKLILKSVPLPQDFEYSFKEPYDELFFHTPDGARLNALYFHANKPKGIVLIFHGRGGNLAKPWGKIAREFTERGYDVLIPDYRGFGKSKGKINQETLLADADHLYKYAASRYQEDQIILHGISFGTGIVCYLSSQYHPKLTLLEAPYYSMRSLIPEVGYTWLPEWVIDLILKYPLESSQWLSKTNAPVVIIHGNEDELIPIHHGKSLFSTVPKEFQKEFIEIAHAGHSHMKKHPEYQQILNSMFGRRDHSLVEQRNDITSP